MLTGKEKPLENQVVFLLDVDPQGFEPRLTVPKTGVLPLHYRSALFLVVQIYNFFLYTQISVRKKFNELSLIFT